MGAIEFFLEADTFAVAGASTDPEKYGHQVFRSLLQSGRRTYPLNPRAAKVIGESAYASINQLPEVPQSLSIVTPPAVTRQLVNDAIAAGVKNLWMQPGAEDASAGETAREAGLNVVDDGSCILVLLSRENASGNKSGK